MASGKTVEPATDPLYSEYLVEEEQTEEKPKKKKKMTAAERLAKKLKQEQDFKILEMRDLMRREYEMSKKTAKKYQERWEEMCRVVKQKELKEDLEYLEIQTNRVLKQKDEKIELILDEIATTEEMHKQKYSSQLQVIDYIMDTWKTFQTTSHLLYENQVSELLQDFYKEVEERSAIEETVKVNCESVMHCTALITENEKLTDYQIFVEKRDDRVNKQIEKRYRLRDAIVKKMKDLRKQLVNFLNALINVSLDATKYERINLLMERQRNFVVESAKLNNHESKSFRTFSETLQKLAVEERDANRKLNDLKLEHGYFMQMRKNIENEMKLDRELTHEKMKIVTSESFDLLKKFRKLHKFGELLLSLAANCRKFQTESEKVLPWGDFQEPINENGMDNEGEYFKLKVIDLKEHVDIGEDELQSNAQLMKNFWRRQSLAEAQIVLLEDKKSRLLEANEQYINIIRRLSKTENVEDLKETLTVEKVLDH